jgi:FdhD protein
LTLSLDPTRRVRVIRVNDGASNRVEDVAAAEEPLDVRLHGTSFAIVMRTPGRDRELAAGFLLSERIIRSADDIGAVEHCRHPDQKAAHHVVDVFLRGGAAGRVAAHLERRRAVLSNASCGICGRTSIEDLRVDLDPLPAGSAVPAHVIHGLPGSLRAQQRTFDETGGLHAAALFAFDGTLVIAAEDVGRHNAVDKLTGAMVLDEKLPLSDTILMVSGRVSFEIVQKAWIAGIPVVAAISAPTSLAIELADEAGITLLGFVRGPAFNVYSHAARVDGI